MADTNIYILRLQGGHYYIGKSNNPMKRYEEHLRGNGSSWTRLYKPIACERVITNASAFDEDKYTKEYMAKYGIEKVRGGTYVETELSDKQVDSLQTEIWAAQDKCTRCGRSGHFVNACFATTNCEGDKIKGDDEDDDDVGDEDSDDEDDDDEDEDDDDEEDEDEEDEDEEDEDDEDDDMEDEGDDYCSDY
jgi:predicted GIY-YIG superfamily endonuclease